MKHIRMTALALLLIIPVAAFAIDIAAGDGARLDIVSRTSFGIDLDNSYDFGLANELTQVDLVLGLLPYQEITNRGNTQDAVGFISLALQELNLIKYIRTIGYNAPEPIETDNYQTGQFVAGIAKGPWLIQLNAGGNERFTAPWFKGMEYINDGFKLSWAYLDSMVDIRRINAISGMPVITKRGQENLIAPGVSGTNDTVMQFSFETAGSIADRFVHNIAGQMVAAMYNTDSLGLNFKLGTQNRFNSSLNKEDDINGVAFGVDSVIMPYALPGLKIFASMIGTFNYGIDANPDPLAGGARIGYNIPLSNVISVEPWAGLDIGTKFKDGGGTEKPEYEASFGATMRWPGEGGWRKDYILNSEGRVYPGMSVGYKIYESLEQTAGMEHSINFTLFEPKGDAGMFYGIGSEIVVDVVDLTNVTFNKAADFYNPKGGFSILGTVYLDYELSIDKLPGKLVPWTILFYDNLPGATKTADRINDFKVDFGLNLENAIPNTVFGLVWNSGSLIQKERAGFIRLFVEIRL